MPEPKTMTKAPKFPGWSRMSGVERRNAKMHAMFERAREQGVTGLYSGPAKAAP